MMRAATHGDEPEVRRCVDDAYHRYRPVTGQFLLPELDELVILIASGTAHVAIEDTTVVGVLVGWAEADHFHVEHLAVDPAVQGRGIGSGLLDRAGELARVAVRSEIRLSTGEAMTANLGFYPRRGFVESHRALDRGYRQVHFRRTLP